MSIFKFKKFQINQDKCAMKVGTDGVLLGAWATLTENPKNILDIGTGSGVISLMLAQRIHTAQILAIDVELDAFTQSKENFENSSWRDRLTVKHIELQKLDCDIKFDLIVSNPPYFIESLKSKNKAKNHARHCDESLSLEDLFLNARNLLSDKGIFSIIFPFDQKLMLTEIAYKYNLHINKIVFIKGTPQKEYKRILVEFSKIKTPILEDYLIIEEFGRHQYSEKYKSLTKEFYLKF